MKLYKYYTQTLSEKMIKSAENPSTGRNSYDSFEDLRDIRVFIDKVHYSFDMKPYQDYNETL